MQNRQHKLENLITGLVSIPGKGHDEQDWTNGTVMWTTALNVQMYQLISVEDTISLFKSDRTILSQLIESIKKNEEFLIPRVILNHKLVDEMRKKISSGKLLYRPFPPWTDEKHIDLKNIGKRIEDKIEFNPLDRAVIELRLKNADLDFEIKEEHKEYFIKKLKEKGFELHKRALPEILKRYKLFYKPETIKYKENTFDICEILKTGLSQKEYIRNRRVLYILKSK